MMKYKEKALLPEYDVCFSEPQPRTCLEIECTRCRERWLLVVREEWTDWKLIAEEYEKRNKVLVGRLDDVIRERGDLRKRLDATRELLEAAVAELLVRKTGQNADERG
ncbi:MAG: hypothetical protein ABFE13_24815 [Phycisphaerales bacterium]